jgi:hypothetical protein
VRVKAVKATLAVAPREARRMLEMIAKSREYPQAGEAGMSLRALDEGIFKPTWREKIKSPRWRGVEIVGCFMPAEAAIVGV